jgi:hypothetical protein
VVLVVALHLIELRAERPVAGMGPQDSSSRAALSDPPYNINDYEQCKKCVAAQLGVAVAMKVVVTGATGFMGGRLCAALAAAGHDVRAFALPGVVIPLAAGVEDVAYGDVTDEESLVAAFHGRAAVFHAAAVVEAWLPDPSVFHAVR